MIRYGFETCYSCRSLLTQLKGRYHAGCHACCVCGWCLSARAASCRLLWKVLGETKWSSVSNAQRGALVDTLLDQDNFAATKLHMNSGEAPSSEKERKELMG